MNENEARAIALIAQAKLISRGYRQLRSVFKTPYQDQQQQVMVGESGAHYNVEVFSTAVDPRTGIIDIAVMVDDESEAANSPAQCYAYFAISPDERVDELFEPGVI